jgi:hypothetical protein
MGKEAGCWKREALEVKARIIFQFYEWSLY